MLDQILFYTCGLQQCLIELGVELPPVAPMHNGKIHQVAIQFRQMADVLVGNVGSTLYDNVDRVGMALTARFYHVRNMHDVLTTTKDVYTYVQAY
tara:strand:- start:2040 stop:2324 length:285 start_codon:yes stop_codon:yes gene_type:complete